jgi:hypothetical protein
VDICFCDWHYSVFEGLHPITPQNR